MPKDTFLNLPRSKREAVLSQAFVEFATHDYSSASLSRIVREAGIAKGSMYQYFENKRDLYFYLIDSALKMRLDYIAAESPGEDVGFFQRVKSVILASARFDFDHPEISGLITHARSEPPGAELENIADVLIDRSVEFLEGFVRCGLERGEIRGDVDTIVHILDQVSISFSFFLQRNVPGGVPPGGRYIEERAQQLIGLLENGLSKKPNSSYT